MSGCFFLKHGVLLAFESPLSSASTTTTTTTTTTNRFIEISHIKHESEHCMILFLYSALCIYFMHSMWWRCSIVGVTFLYECIMSLAALQWMHCFMQCLDMRSECPHLCLQLMWLSLAACRCLGIVLHLLIVVECSGWQVFACAIFFVLQI